MLGSKVSVPLPPSLTTVSDQVSVLGLFFYHFSHLLGSYNTFSWECLIT
ncbi:rCG25158 [Rattus norvegicus]|uniref:RCG25158 n=1 Tax=Rattus norvegicus TaxID=10116 RepID=A6I2V5_RAT|nr:rCG25158 [Rattus norvegicus]